MPEAWALIRQHAARFAAAVFDYRDFIREDVPNRIKAVVPPGMDPTGARTQPVDPSVHTALLSQRGINLGKPILSQISFMYREGGPLRALDAYEVVKAFRPDVQLVIVNMTGVDTPEQQQVLKEVHARGAKLGGILMLTDLDRVGNVEIARAAREVHRDASPGTPPWNLGGALGGDVAGQAHHQREQPGGPGYPQA